MTEHKGADGQPFNPNWTEIEGIPRRNWIMRCLDIKREPESYGLRPLGNTVCEGGYCNRHGGGRPVAFSTSDGNNLCEGCATIWAARKHYGLKRDIKDL